MQYILLATYNYFPYNWGGSEGYVAGLVHTLSLQGKKVRLFTSVPDDAFIEHGILWSGVDLKVCRYVYQDTIVYGIQHSVTMHDIYCKYRPEWELDWTQFFLFLEKEENGTPMMLHLHGFSAIIGLSLIKSFTNKYCKAPVFATYHTALSCPKGTLLYWDKEECGIRTNEYDCTACILKNHTNLPKWIIYAITKSLPLNISNKRILRPLSWKFLIKNAIASFQELANLVDHWWVFSEQTHKILIIQGVSPSKIRMGRHGISPIFLNRLNSTNRNNSPIIFAYVGRFKMIKGIYTLLKAWKNLPITDNRVLWLIGEESDDEPEINKLLHELKNRKDVICHGKKSQTELVNIYHKIHALIVPSECVETGPLVVHEALSCNAMIIGSDIGGTKELAKYYPGCIKLFSMGNVESLFAQLNSFQYKRTDAKVYSQEDHYIEVENWYSASEPTA